MSSFKVYGFGVTQQTDASILTTHMCRSHNLSPQPCYLVIVGDSQGVSAVDQKVVGLASMPKVMNGLCMSGRHKKIVGMVSANTHPHRCGSPRLRFPILVCNVWSANQSIDRADLEDASSEEATALIAQGEEKTQQRLVCNQWSTRL